MRPALWFRIAVALTILALLAFQLPMGRVAELLSGAQPGLVAAAVAATMAGQVLVGVRFAALLRAAGMPIRGIEAFAVNLATVFYGLFLPGGNVTGALLRFAGLIRRSGDPQAILIGIACDRLIATVTLCLSGLLAALLVSRGHEPLLTALMLASFTGLACIQILLFTPLVWRSGQTPEGLESVAGRFSLVRPNADVGDVGGQARASAGPANRVAAWVRKLANLIAGMAQRARQIPFAVQARALMLGLLSHALGILAWYLAALALDLGHGAATLGWVRAAAMIAALLPVSVSGIGLREGTVVILLSALGTSGAQGMAFALLVFTVTVLTPAIAGSLIEARRLLVAPRPEP